MPEKPPSAAFLNRTLYTTSHVFEALKERAEVEGTTPDALATTILAREIGNDNVDWLVQRARKDREKRMEEYRARITKPNEEDQLP